MANSKTVSFRLSVWANSSTREIHVAAKEVDLISKVSNDPKSVRYHPNLFRKLRKVLANAGKWPEGM
jgi:hypothetical protein